MIAAKYIIDNSESILSDKDSESNLNKKYFSEESTAQLPLIANKKKINMSNIKLSKKSKVKENSLGNRKFYCTKSNVANFQNKVYSLDKILHDDSLKKWFIESKQISIFEYSR